MSEDNKQESKPESSASELASKGGKARAKALSPEQRKEIARKAVEARWAKKGEGKEAVVAPHSGVIKIGDLEIACAVLADGTRVLHERGILKALGLSRSGRAHNQAKEASEGGAQLPLYVAQKNLTPYIDLELASVLKKPI